MLVEDSQAVPQTTGPGREAGGWAGLAPEAWGPSATRPYAHTAATSWYEEFRRLYDTVPCVEVQTLEEHTDQVLHLSFSHSGYQFASCSKDCTVKVRAANPVGREGQATSDSWPVCCIRVGRPRTWTTGLDHPGWEAGAGRP